MPCHNYDNCKNSSKKLLIPSYGWSIKIYKTKPVIKRLLGNVTATVTQEDEVWYYPPRDVTFHLKRGIWSVRKNALLPERISYAIISGSTMIFLLRLLGNLPREVKEIILDKLIDEVDKHPFQYDSSLDIEIRYFYNPWKVLD